MPSIYLKKKALFEKKVMKAKMDSGPQSANSALSEEMQNLFQIMQAVSSSDTVSTL